MKYENFLNSLTDGCYVGKEIATKHRSSYEDDDFTCTDYDSVYQLCPIRNQADNVIGFAVSEQHCGKGDGCFWTEEDFQECTLEEWNRI